MANATPEELATQAATPAWRALPAVQQAAQAVSAALAGKGHGFNADGLTAALAAFNVHRTVHPVPSIIEAVQEGLV